MGPGSGDPSWRPARTPSPPARGRGRSPGGCSHGPFGLLAVGKRRLMLSAGRHRNGEGRAGNEIVGTSNGDGKRGERRREREALRVRGGDEQDEPDPALRWGGGASEG